jgi:hypothetical protein
MIDLKEIATEIVLFYFQSWGQTAEKRIEVLNNGVEAAGIKAIYMTIHGNSGWNCDTDAEGERAKKFREELDKCFPQGQFEDEVDAVIGLLKNYQSTKRRKT